MKVKLLAHTQLSEEFIGELSLETDELLMEADASHGQVLALTAIRNCYSSNKPSEIVNLESKKYFGKDKDINRLINHIMKSGHTSTVEHLQYTFAIEGVSRALLAQLTRHRVGFSFSVQSQRYVKFSSDSKSGGFDYVVPEKVKAKGLSPMYRAIMSDIQADYNKLIELGIPQEDARSVLPQSATCNLVLTVNLRALLDFYAKRRAGKGAQQEITVLVEELKDKVVSVEPWIAPFFEVKTKEEN